MNTFQIGETVLIPGGTLTRRSKRQPQPMPIKYDMIVIITDISTNGNFFKMRRYPNYLPVSILRKYTPPTVERRKRIAEILLEVETTP